MATDTQYKVFKEVYDQESERYSNLGTRASLYLTLITFYLGAVLLKVDDVLKFVTTFHVPVVLFLLSGALLVAALFLTALAVTVRDYEGICDPEKVIKGFGESPPSDEEFLDDRIVDLAVATNRNNRQNNRVATLLKWAARVICCSVALQTVVLFIAIRHARG
jgi:hypothetical protein